MSLLWHIATQLARGAFKVPVIPVEITTADVPPYARINESSVNDRAVPNPVQTPDAVECARSACKNLVVHPVTWCSDDCQRAWCREYWRLTA